MATGPSRPRGARARRREAEAAPGRAGLAEAVARNFFKLMAYKDEYEVARLYADGEFLRQVDAAFDGALTFEFHLAPPLFARPDPATGEPRKMRFGPWMLKALGLLAKFRGLRGSPLDIFGYSAERRAERALISDYERLLDEVLGALTLDNHAFAVALASIPEKIRGYGPVKMRHLAAAKAEEADLLARFRAPPRPQAQAAE